MSPRLCVATDASVFVFLFSVFALGVTLRSSQLMIPQGLGGGCARAHRPHLVAQGLGGHTQGSGSSQSAAASAFHPACSGPQVGVAPASRCVRRTCVTSVALWGPQNSEQFATFTDRSPKARFTHSQPLWGVGAPRQKLQNLFLPSYGNLS